MVNNNSIGERKLRKAQIQGVFLLVMLGFAVGFAILMEYIWM